MSYGEEGEEGVAYLRRGLPLLRLRVATAESAVELRSCKVGIQKKENVSRGLGKL